MRPDALLIALDLLDMIVEGDDLGAQADFFVKLAKGGLAQGLADLDAAARQRVEALQRRPRAPRDQRPALLEHGQRHGEDRPRRIKAVALRRHTCWPPLIWISAPCT